MRPSNRATDQMRPVTLTLNYTMHAEGSVLVEFGHTRVLCNASIDERVPGFLRGKGQGWVTAEYGMLPRSTTERMGREAARGKQGGRTMEIQRLIGRSLRAVVDMKSLGERTVTIDCDVIQADGGTRTASITGGFVALATAVQKLVADGTLKKNPLTGAVASVSVGIYQGTPLPGYADTRSRLPGRFQRGDRYECGDDRQRSVHRSPGNGRGPPVQPGRNEPDAGAGQKRHW